MKALAGISVPDHVVLEFTRLLDWFDRDHPGCVIQLVSDTALPADVRPLCARLAPGLPAIDPRRFDRDRD